MKDLEANFMVFTKLVLQLLPNLLRMYSKRRWNAKYPTEPWQDTPCSGMLMVHGSSSCDVDLDGSTTVKNDSGKVLTTADLTDVLADGDKVQLDGRVVCSVLAMSKKGFTINHKWEHVDCTGLVMKGHEIKCEKKLPKAMQHAKPKIKAGNCDKLDIIVMTFALVNSSHKPMEGETEKQLKSVSKLRTIRNEQYGHASKNFMTHDELVEVNTHVKRFTRLCLPDRATWCQQQIDEGICASNQAVDLTKVEETMNQLQDLLNIKSGGSSAPPPDAPFVYSYAPVNGRFEG